MSQLVGEKLVLSVAQIPFEALSDGGAVNLFGTLAPLFLEDGGLASEADFPNNGLVWWMLRQGAHGFAQPGRLVTGVLELAQRYEAGDPDKTVYQVNRESLEPVKGDDVIEIVAVNRADVRSARDLVNLKGVVTLDHPPASLVLVRWRDELYGPFRATSEAGSSARNEHFVSLAKRSASQEILRIPGDRVQALRRLYLGRLRIPVSLEQRQRARSSRLVDCEYELLRGAGLAELEQGAVDRLRLESDSEVLLRLSKDLLTPRKKRQEFGALLRELEEKVHTTLGADSEAADVVRGVIAAIERTDQDARVLTDGVLTSGLLDQRIEDGIRARFERHVQENAAGLQAEIAQRTAQVQRELEGRQRERESLSDEISSRRRRAEAELERELDARRKEFEDGVREERERLTRQRRELDEQREVLSRHLESVVERFKQSRDDVVNQFLALQPLFSATGLLGGRSQEVELGGDRPAGGMERDPVFTLPHFVTGAAEAPPVISEGEFFDRFRRHVSASGFVFRDADLISFHLSVKCCDMTVVGGVSGTGKSSLPRLYLEALAGAEPGGAARLLNVAVSPGWLDMRDLLGHVNALEGRFQPGESALYQFLIWAGEEYRRKAQDSGLYLVCLDEMNLSHVEHYFSGFLQALEQPPGSRRVRCFSAESVVASSTFAPWPSLELPRSLRFVGTVNLDETTKPLSIRLLDRVNFMRLRAASVPEILLDSQEDPQPAVSGPPVTLRSYRSWVRTAQLDLELAGIVDQIRPYLATLGCPLNPRRYRALCTFVASAPPEICSPLVALDLQIAQRLVPEIRNLFRRDAQVSVERLMDILGSHPSGFPFSESVSALEDVRGSEFGGAISQESTEE